MSHQHIRDKSAKINLGKSNVWPREFGTKLHPIDPGMFTKPWEKDRLPGESDMQRAFRRFPINSHKPGR